MVDNMTILEKAWLEGSNDFQQRIPRPSQNSVAKTAAALQEPMNGDLWNEFLGLMNMVGFTIVLQQAWENPLAVFKKEPLRWGKTIRVAAPKWIRAHAFDDTATDLLKMDRVEWEQWFHTVNRADKYLFDYNETELMWAVADDGASNSLNALLLSAATAARNSDEYDEMNYMLNAIANADAHWKRPLFKHQLSAFPHDDATGAEFLKAIKAYAGKLRFPSTTFNSLNVPVFARPNELVLLITPEADAAVNVDTLARVFNIDRAEVPLRKVMVPYIPIDGAVAVLTTEDFFETRDTKYGIWQFFDPNTLNTQNFLHHQGIVDVSPFVPCIVFTTANGTEVPTVKMSATGMALAAEAPTVTPGGKVQITAKLTGTVTPEGTDVRVKPDSALFSVTAADADGKAKALNSRTFVDRFGILHVQKGDLVSGDVLTVTASSAYANPDGPTTVYTQSVEVTVANPDPAADDEQADEQAAEDEATE